ncbi:unnamed protein product [Musa banksii]
MPEGTVASEWEMIMMFLVAMPGKLLTGAGRGGEVCGERRVPVDAGGGGGGSRGAVGPAVHGRGRPRSPPIYTLNLLRDVLQPSSAGSSSSTSFPASPLIESATSPRASSSAPSTPRSRASSTAWPKTSPKLPPASSTFARASTPPSTPSWPPASPTTCHRPPPPFLTARHPHAGHEPLSPLAGSPRDGHRGLRKFRFGRDPAALPADQARGGVGGQRAAFLWSLKGWPRSF